MDGKDGVEASLPKGQGRGVAVLQADPAGPNGSGVAGADVADHGGRSVEAVHDARPHKCGGVGRGHALAKADFEHVLAGPEAEQLHRPARFKGIAFGRKPTHQIVQKPVGIRNLPAMSRASMAGAFRKAIT